MTPQRITIADIAARAGTSASTVSKVLNGRPGVGNEKRDQILALLDGTRYKRRGAGRRSQSGLIDIVFADIHGLWSARLLYGAETAASRFGVALVVSSVHSRTLGNRHWVEKFKERCSVGLVVVATRLRPELSSELRRLRAPYVFLDPLGAVPEDVPVISCTNFAGARDATQHLVDLGHRRIALITGPADLLYSQERLDGYRVTLDRANLPYGPDYVRFGAMNEESGCRLGAELLDLPEPPTAIFAGSDLHAHGVYEAAADRGLVIPDDLSVVGFDNLPSGKWSSPKLTTVDQPLEDMGALAIQTLLVAARQDVGQTGQRFELATTLVVRQSTAPPRSSR